MLTENFVLVMINWNLIMYHFVYYYYISDKELSQSYALSNQNICKIVGLDYIDRVVLPLFS